jgi:hypothetical protein
VKHRTSVSFFFLRDIIFIVGFAVKSIRKTPHDFRREQVKDLRIKFLTVLIIFYNFENIVN